MNCDACLHRCKSDCCRGPIPMPADHLTRFPQVREANYVLEAPGGMVVAMHITADRHGVCPFLGLDNKCSIYADRPEVCRLFGSEKVAFLTCSYQAADGRIRQRAERRAIERMHVKGNAAHLQHILKQPEDA